MQRLQTVFILLLCSLALPSWAECVATESGDELRYAKSNPDSCYGERNWLSALLGRVPQGTWEIRFEDGTVASGTYVDGNAHGLWGFRSADGTAATGPLVDGKKHGQWEERWADGRVDTGPFVDGKRHGQWEIRDADSEATGAYVDGEKHGLWIASNKYGDCIKEEYQDGIRFSSQKCY